MKNILLFIILLIFMSACTLIENIETISDHVDDTINPNSQSCGTFNQYKISNKNIKVPELKEKRELAVDTALDALDLWGYALNDNSNSEKELQKMSYKKFLEALEITRDYKDLVVQYNYVKEEKTAAEALKALETAEFYHKSGEYKKAIREIEYAFLLLVDNKEALWLWQNDNDLVFPDYLKWDESTMKGSKSIVGNPDSLVFSGGGVKGTAYAGILKYLVESGMLKNVKRFAGTSVGAIMCAFTSMGEYYNKNRLPGSKNFWEVVYEMTMKNDFIDFVDNNALRKSLKEDNFAPFTDNIVNSVASISKTLDKQYALCDGNKLTEFLQRALKKFGFDENITLKELHNLTGKHLVLVSCSLSYRKAAYFDYKSAPDLRVVDAIRASMALPFIFKPVKYNNDFFVDGGAANNFPINYFDESMYNENEKPKVLGFILYTKKEILRPEWRMLKNPVDYAGAVSDLIMINTGSALFKKNVDRTVFIDCGKIDVMSFNITEEEKKKNIQAGYDSIKKYFNQDYEVKNDYAEKTVDNSETKHSKKEDETGLSWYLFYPELTFVSPRMWNVYGLCLGIPVSITKNIYGMQLSLLINNTKRVTGLSIALLNNVNKSIDGILLSFINNFNCKYNSDAMLLGFVNNTNSRSDCNILQIAAFNHINNILELNASQIGLLNTIESKFNQFDGFQIGLSNTSNSMTGFQLGLFNSANSSFRGMQLGLINKIENGWIKYLPLINLSFNSMNTEK